MASVFTWAWHSILRGEAEFHPVKPWIVELFIVMKDEVVVTLNFFIVAVITLFLIPPYLLAIFEPHQIVFNDTLEAWMLVFYIFLLFVVSLNLLFQQLGSFPCIICPALLHNYYKRRISGTWLLLFLLIFPDLDKNWNRYSPIRKLIALLYILRNYSLLFTSSSTWLKRCYPFKLRNFNLMRQEVVLSSYFLLLATFVLLLAPNYLLPINQSGTKYTRTD